MNEQQAQKLGLKVDDCLEPLFKIESHWRKIAEGIKVIEKDSIVKNFSAVIREKLAEPMHLALDEIQKSADSCAENIKNVLDAMRGWWCLVPVSEIFNFSRKCFNICIFFF